MFKFYFYFKTSVSESTYFALISARTRIFNKYKVNESNRFEEKAEINGRLVCYCSDQAHSSVEKAALVGLVRIRILPHDENLSLRGDTLLKAIEQDKCDGLIPFFVCATLGTTGTCAFDCLSEIGPLCKAQDVWLHIDAAYAGSALLCPEFRKFSKGVEYATSFVFNPSKWLMVHFDCTCFWVDNVNMLHQTFTVDPLYLKHKYSGAAIDYMHWQIGLSRRFRSLKLWFVIRSFGISGLQAHIRKGVQLALLFENLVRTDERFDVIAERHLGLVVFRLKVTIFFSN
jgi:histidine decarboxylase